MNAAKMMDVIARLPDCAGQGADAVSAHTSVKLGMLPDCSKIPKSECPDVWIRLPRHKWPKSWETLMIPWYLLHEIYMVTYYLHCYGKDNSKKLYENLGGRKYRIGNVCSFIENKGYFCQ